MKFNYIILVTTVFFFGSCKLLTGISNPKEKSKEKLDSFLIRIGCDTSNNYVFLEEAFDSLKNLPYKPNWPVGFRPIQYKVFNSSGSLISQYASCEGSYKKLKIFETFPPKNIWPIDSTQNFAADVKMYRNYSGSKLNLDAQQAELNIIIYWGTWMGKYGKGLLKELTRYKKKHPGHKVIIYKVNVGEYFVN